MMRRRVVRYHTKKINTCDLYCHFPPIYTFLHTQPRFYKPQALSKSSQLSQVKQAPVFCFKMEGTHLSSMKQEPSSNPGKPTTRNIAFSWQPKSPSRAETSQIMNKAQTWCSYPGVENVGNEVKEQAAEALILMHRESVALTTTTTTGRERLKRHREEVSGKVMIPDTWGQENLLTDWIDYSSFDKLLAPKGITSAREALVAEGRRARTSHQRLGVESSC